MDCKEGTRHIAKQMTDLLSAIDNDTYSRSLEVFNGSSVGQHFRHIIDFYNCLLNGECCGTVDYCKRERNPAIETDTQTAISVIEDILRQVAIIEEKNPIQVVSDFSANEDLNRIVIQSSLGRELMYAYDHALHHLALIKIGMQINFPNIKLDENLGVAPSTIKYKRILAQAEKTGES